MLEGYPEQRIANYLLFGIREGFRVGFNRSSPLRSAKSNMKSAAEHPEVVSRYLSEEVKEGRVLGPFSMEDAEAASWHISKFGVIPKRHKENTFLRRLYDLLASVKANRHHIYLNAAARSDLAWWFTFLGSWNGVSILRTQQSALIHHTVVSDASGQWGCGAYSDRRWFQLCWSGSSVQEESIMVKELIPIVIAAAVWGKHWTGHTVQCKCDNESVVAVIASRTSKNIAVMHLLRCLFFFEASLNFCITATHLPGAQNELADDLSRNRLSDFLQKAPSMQPGPCGIPQELRELLFSPLDWTSPSWRLRFSTILRMA